MNYPLMDLIAKFQKTQAQVKKKAIMKYLKSQFIKKTKVRHKGSSKKRSWVWKYFDSEKVIEKSKNVNIEVMYGICLVLDNSEEKCNTWLRIVSGSTLNLINHLSNIYSIMKDGPKLYKQDNPMQTTIDLFARSGPYPYTKSKNDKLTKALVKFLIHDAQPISFAVSPNFHEFIKELDLMFSLPDEKCVKQIIYALYNKSYEIM
ncbi:14960_t:CDS:2 [Dentiscutata erythropus]|uniref:14960_t:CDS:1 n=1 Tax=Dentiscutata erythropus TaxID=1348616 RepID=A0A9N8WB03_9GLOM|nr:14960_t:CDS:2 [Dentiscutata erythropus]